MALNKDKIGGKIKEAAGKITGDKKLEVKGKLQSVKGEVKDKAHKVKHDLSKKVDQAMK